jgi:IS5 family transposase
MKSEQTSFASVPFDRFAKTTRRAVFLAEMDAILPWKEMCDVVRPHYPTGEGGGRVPIDLERMLRIHFLQQWFNLSDPGAEEALYDILSMREFARIDLGRAPVPDETTICKFRHLLEKHKLGDKLFKTVNAYLRKSGVKVTTGTIVDATIIHAPSSTKNADKERDPEMHQTKKGNQWYFGMKAHIGVDSKTRTIHTVVATAANVHDSKVLPELMHGKERRVYGDSAYRGQREVMVNRSKHARDFTNKRAYRNSPLTESDKETNRRKSGVRSYVEHAFGIIKGRFGFQKVRYRGLAKNLNRLNVLAALANIVICKKRLLRALPAS